MNTIHHMREPNPSPAPRQPDSTITLQVPTAQAMHELGERLARSLHGGEVILLSGPLGAGKTTLAQGLGKARHSRTHRLTDLHHRKGNSTAPSLTARPHI